MKTITIELSPQSCKKAAKELDVYNKSLKSKQDEVCRKLAQIGALEAQMHITYANGNTDATFSVAKMDGGYKIVMAGHDVYFIEFGTGSDVSAHYEVSVPVFAGSWSMEHSQRYAKAGFWWYGGELLTGTPAYMPMYYAGKKIREEIPNVVKEVFGK